MSEKLEDANPGNLLVSAVRKVIKEEQADSNLVVETSDGDGFREIVKAADASASRVGAGHGVDKDKIHRGKGSGGSPNDKTSLAKGSSKGISKENSGKLKKIGKKYGKGSNTWSHLARPGGRAPAAIERKTREKVE